jgi:hypothetical protein
MTNAVRSEVLQALTIQTWNLFWYSVPRNFWDGYRGLRGSCGLRRLPVFWDVTPYSLVNSYQPLKTTRPLDLDRNGSNSSSVATYIPDYTESHPREEQSLRSKAQLWWSQHIRSPGIVYYTRFNYLQLLYRGSKQAFCVVMEFMRTHKYYFKGP